MKRSKKSARLPKLPLRGRLSTSLFSRTWRARSVSQAEQWMHSLIQPIAPNEQATAREHRPRLKVVLVAMCLVFGVLMLRLTSLQLLTGARYLHAAEGNRIRDTIAYAPRGVIYDRHGKILARNSADYQLSVTPYLLPRQADARQAIYERLAGVLGQSADSLQAITEAKGVSYSLPVLIAEHLPHDEMLRVEEILPELKGFAVDVIPVRQYVADAGLAHILGYVGRVSEQDLSQRDDILPTDFVGRSGVEQQYDAILRGHNGHSRVEVDSLGRPVRLLAKQTVQTGGDITLTIDYNLQVKLAERLKAQMKKVGVKRASAIMMDPNNGEILAMVSLPSYDDNLFSRGISRHNFDTLLKDPNQPLVNKAISASYPSASTIKPIIAAAALQEGVITDQTVIVDPGFIDIPNRYNPSITYRFKTWKAGGLGPLTVRRALAMSSNVFFYTVAGGHGKIGGLGVDRLTSYYRQFGLGERTGVDLPGETAGRVPDPEWKKKVTGEPWYLGDTYNIAIGQGELKVTPLQMAVAHTALANGGHLLKPHVLFALGKNTTTSSVPTQIRRTVSIDQRYIQVVHEGMHEMIYNGAYCACRFRSIPVEIAGKTGTAETDEVNKDSQPHAWFVGYGPWQDPQILTDIMLEQGRKSANALFVGTDMLSYYFTHSPH